MIVNVPTSKEIRSSLPRVHHAVSEKIRSEHLEGLAMVYIRQSTPQQVLNHQESTRAQYNLKARAIQLGWPEERIVIIDEDLGKSGSSAEGRSGFQRLVSEVSLGHVGLILGLEMSRLARSCKDWHQLLEVCGIFGTLIADLDGIYDPGQFNDRLLLGLKGTMSEAELHIIKQRMSQGRLNKARRGELAFPLPIGYFRRPSGEVVLDPDEQVREVIRLIFQKFEELGALHAVLRYLVKHGVKLGVRIREGECKGELEWRRPNRMTLQNLLHNPMYAGAYSYGRRKVDPRGKVPGRPGTGRRVQDPAQWGVFLKDRFPAYISWDQYERNVRRLRSNRARADEIGAVRHGPALLSGLLVCGKCSRRMTVSYSGAQRHAYLCARQVADYGGEVCQNLAGRQIDAFVTSRILQALAPASLELSMEAAKNLERERKELDDLWKQRLERASYETERARKQYNSVDPENRLVARQLEADWEGKLLQQKGLEEEFHRYKQQLPRVLSEEEREQIRRLATDIPALWNSPGTTDADRKEIIRQVVNRVELAVKGESELVDVTIEWATGTRIRETTVRPVAKLEQLSYFPDLCKRIQELVAAGEKAAMIAAKLNEEGFRPPKRRETFGPAGISDLIHRLGLGKPCFHRRQRSGLKEDEWWLRNLAKETGIPPVTLYAWVRRGWVKSRMAGTGRAPIIIWADTAEINRLKTIHQRNRGYATRQLWVGDENLNSGPLKAKE